MIQSDGFGFTLSSKKWFAQNWNPINEAGFRDYEHEWKENIVFVTGDSFVAGHGIDSIDDRFSSVLNQRLGTEWTVATLADNGWGPSQELNALREHPQKPDHVIVSYYPNDIQSAAEVHGSVISGLNPGIANSFLAAVVNHSYAANFLYWRFVRTHSVVDYWTYLEQAFDDPEIWAAHTAELEEFRRFADEQDIDLSFVIWPLLFDIETTRPMTDKVVAWLVENEIPYIDLTSIFEGRHPKDLVVNSMDGHPNVRVNSEVGNLIFEELGFADQPKVEESP